MASSKLGPLKPSESVNDLFYLNNSNTGVDDTLRNIFSGNGTQLPILVSSSQVQLSCNLGYITKPILDVFRYKFYDAGSQSSSYALSTANGNFQRITLASSISLTVTNDVESGNAFEITLVVQQSSGGHTITFPASFKITGSSGLSFSSTASAVDIFKISTFDGGTTWYVANISGGGGIGGGTFTNPMTTDGDIIIQSSSVPARLGKGTDGQFLWTTSGLPAWRTLAASDIPSLAASKITSGQLTVALGGTGADLSATGGTSQVLKQASAGASITVGTLAHSELTGLTTGDPHTQYLITSPTSGSTRNILAPALGNHKDVLVIQQSDANTYPGLGIDVWYFGVVKDGGNPAWMLWNMDGVFTKVQQAVDLELLLNKGVKFFNSANTFSFTIKAASALGSNLSLTLPSANGSAGQFLQTNGSGGVLSWVSLAASDIASGTIATARLGSGSASSSTVLYGDQTYKTIGGTSALSQITSNQNDYALGDTNFQAMYTVSSDTNGRNITGIAGGSAGRVIRILNTGSYDIILTNQDSSSSAANRIQMPYDLDMVLRPNDCWTLAYDTVSSRWFVVTGYEGYIEDPMFCSEMHDDFVWGTNGNGTFGELGWSFNNNGGTPNITADETGYLGACKITSGTVSSGRGELVSNNPVNMSLPTGLIFEAMVRFPTLSATTNTTNAYTSIVGISNSMAATGAVASTQHSIAFCYDRVGANANWKGLTSGASITSTDTGVAVSTSYQRLKFVYNTAGTSCKFYINEALVATNITNFPSSAPYAVKFGIWNLSGNTTSMTMYVENFKMRILRTTRRA